MEFVDLFALLGLGDLVVDSEDLFDELPFANPFSIFEVNADKAFSSKEGISSFDFDEIFAPEGLAGLRCFPILNYNSSIYSIIRN